MKAPLVEHVERLRKMSPEPERQRCATCESYVASGERGSILLPHETWCVYTRWMLAEKRVGELERRFGVPPTVAAERVKQR